jgi:hypothetical protein
MVKLQNTSAIIDVLGGNTVVAKMLGTTNAAISNWRAANRFPARTYLVLIEALERKDCTASDRLWSMRRKVAANG